MEVMSIGEVARRAGLRPSALRYYESVGLLPKPRRANGRRSYDASVLPVLAVLQMGRQAGFTIAELQALFDSFDPGTTPAARWARLAEQKLEELDQQIRQAQEMKLILQRGLQCGCLRFEDCVLVNGELCP